MRIAYETRGSGDTAVVLVHGWVCDRSYFRHQLDSLPEKYQVVASDLAGHGESPVGCQNSTIASGADADPALVNTVATDMSSAPPLVGTTSIVSSFKYAREIQGALAALKLPVIAINADNGPTDEASLARHGVKSVVMSGTGHFLMLEDPKRFDTLLVSAIEELQ
jgi:pimeloyl-ACP methyl ester carboxylesterase